MLADDTSSLRAIALTVTESSSQAFTTQGTTSSVAIHKIQGVLGDVPHRANQNIWIPDIESSTALNTQ